MHREGKTTYSLFKKPESRHLYLHPGCNIKPAINVVESRVKISVCLKLELVENP